MADDQIFNYIQQFIDGEITRNAFWELARFKHPTHQVSFHTEKALHTLRFSGEKEGSFDNVRSCRYAIPGYWDIGKVYARAMEDTDGSDVLEAMENVYDSLLDQAISNYNSDFYYQARDYIAQCYFENKIL